MENTNKLKVALMWNIRESNLPKKGKLLLLDLVVENEDLKQTLEILESFEVISEEAKRTLIFEAWADSYSGGIYRLAGRAAKAIFSKCVRKCGIVKGSYSSERATGRKMCLLACKNKLARVASIKDTEKGRIASAAGLDQPIR